MARESSSSRPASESLHDFAARARDEPLLRRLDAAAAEALAAFAAAGANALLLKGPALAQALYAGEHRPYSDVDVLVAPGDVEAARRTLADLGYVSTSEGVGIDDVAGVAMAEEWVRAGGNDDAGRMIDLHWALPGTGIAAGVAWEALAARRAWIDVAGSRTPTLDAVGLAVHVALHAAQHGTRYGKPLADLERGVERWPREVWRDAAELAAELGAGGAFAAGLRLTPAGAVLADALGLPAADAAAWAIEHRYKRPRGTFHLEALAAARTPRERASILRRSLLPRREWIRWQYPWAHRGRLRLVAAYALHLMRTPLWAVRALRFRRRQRRVGP